MQGNRLTKIENVSTLVQLEELYVSDNGLDELGGLDQLLKLQTLDVANNQLTRLTNMKHLPQLTEFWVCFIQMIVSPTMSNSVVQRQSNYRLARRRRRAGADHHAAHRLHGAQSDPTRRRLRLPPQDDAGRAAVDAAGRAAHDAVKCDSHLTGDDRR